MQSEQEQFDDAMFDFSRDDLPGALGKLKELLARNPEHFDAQLSLGMAYYRQGDYAAALREGHQAEKLRPKEQLVHTNLSLFYLKAGDKTKAEYHGLQARIASWRNDSHAPTPSGADPELELAKPPPAAPVQFPEMPWKKKAVPPPGTATPDKKDL